MTIVQQLEHAFADLSRCLRLFWSCDDFGRISVNMYEIDENDAFLQACAEGLRRKVQALEDKGEAVSVLEFGGINEHLHVVLLKAQELQTYEQFLAEVEDPWGARAGLECDALINALEERGTAIDEHLQDEHDRMLVDALFGLGNDRWSNTRSMKLLQQVADQDRRYLAPVLVTFLDETAVDHDLKLNAYRLAGEPVERPVCQDLAFQILTRWSAVPEESAEWWVDQGVLSPELIVGEE